MKTSERVDHLRGLLDALHARAAAEPWGTSWFLGCLDLLARIGAYPSDELDAAGAVSALRPYEARSAMWILGLREAAASRPLEELEWRGEAILLGRAVDDPTPLWGMDVLRLAGASSRFPPDVLVESATRVLRACEDMVVIAPEAFPGLEALAEQRTKLESPGNLPGVARMVARFGDAAIGRVDAALAARQVASMARLRKALDGAARRSASPEAFRESFAKAGAAIAHQHGAQRGVTKIRHRDGESVPLSGHPRWKSLRPIVPLAWPIRMAHAPSPGARAGSEQIASLPEAGWGVAYLNERVEVAFSEAVSAGGAELLVRVTGIDPDLDLNAAGAVTVTGDAGAVPAEILRREPSLWIAAVRADGSVIVAVPAAGVSVGLDIARETPP